jgi:hypothetical protein
MNYQLNLNRIASDLYKKRTKNGHSLRHVALLIQSDHATLHRIEQLKCMDINAITLAKLFNYIQPKKMIKYFEP